MQLLNILLIILGIGSLIVIGFIIFIGTVMGKKDSDLTLDENHSNCHLKNGKYKLIYDKAFSDYPKLEFKVNGEKLTEINSEINRTFKIELLGENSFQLKSEKKRMDSLAEAQKAIVSYGKPYYEIIDCTKDTIEFVKRVDLHITSYSGKFVRIN